MNNILRTTLLEIKCCWQCGRLLACEEQLEDIRLVWRLLRLCSHEALWPGLARWNRDEELLLLYCVLQWTSILCNVYNGLQLHGRPSEKSLGSLTWWHVNSSFSWETNEFAKLVFLVKAWCVSFHGWNYTA